MKTEQPILMYMLLTLFIGLKLTGYIEWSWWLVLAPMWGYVAVTFIFGFVAGFYRAMKLNRDKTCTGRAGQSSEG